MTGITDKLDNLDEVFNNVVGYFGVLNVTLSTIDDDTEVVMGDIYLHSLFDSDEQELQHIIFIRNGMMKYVDYYGTIEKRLFGSIEEYGYEINSLTRTVMMLCHEYGHIHHIDLAYSFNQEELFHLINNTSEQFMKDPQFQQIRKQVAGKYNLDMKYVFSVDEMYADWFALKHFPKVMRYLKDKGIQ